MKSAKERLDALWATHDSQWRHPAQVASQWREAADVDPKLLDHRVRGKWWQTLERTGATLLVTREYEHLAMALSVTKGRPIISYLSIPHPSGLAIDRQTGTVHLASTRNPNQILDLVPVTSAHSRLDVRGAVAGKGRPLFPVRSRFFPGCLYLHDLALINGALFGNAVGENAVVRIDPTGTYKRVWWPKCIEVRGKPSFGQNYIQLNSIAAGVDLKSSYFSASADLISTRRPGHRNFPVDKRGVIFSGKTREPIARGLTRPHSARIFRGRVWVSNSGYGEVGIIRDGGFESVSRLRGWTRGLCFCSGIAFAGTSRILPRFHQYAPGLKPDQAECGVHAVDPASGRVLGSLIWPRGNQIFSVDWLPARLSLGFPFTPGTINKPDYLKRLFYTFETSTG